MQLNYDDSKVEWIYAEKKIEYYIEGIEIAEVTNNKIYVVIYCNGFFRYKYFDFSGYPQLSYSENADVINIIDSEKREHQIEIFQLKDAVLSNNNIYVIAGDREYSKVIVYTSEGKKINEYAAPPKYSCYRFGNLNDKINIVCIGAEKTKDKYGRNDWNFVLNIETGIWTLKSLSY